MAAMRLVELGIRRGGDQEQRDKKECATHGNSSKT
jgi:hypothetical protein